MMSLEEINAEEKKDMELFELEEGYELSTNHPVRRIYATARAAHELKAEVQRLSKAIANRNFEQLQLMKINLFAELAKARAEERERCAKLADRMDDYVAKAIRALKD